MEGTRHLTWIERGTYALLLFYEWDVGGVPADDLRALAAIIGCTVREAAAQWERIGPKFTRGEDGLWRNTRCERDLLRATIRSKAQAARARSRWSS
jgi:uncharacterized protein YdaU (DUF1376 family)